ncbi:uncharacterized protein PGTG_06050 [Puccinia graminis f. sp. tritici CRL 75-36-700-3]|uniref:No apical meristem-associated C-terminal domain-containing protein n=1 Tax=Puccinia graminis f. sp. tritici (strain CRL 75-36-700-3 / race SCCL) TaxID=418459 RepID=E3K5D3_PUCGT|nr:uncharacterized protein PGTG_06050 [Puccinia graminis f. sp. tritici CRL 75-36-700-3]EFP79729.1 hypothetical protein PGTG_06050 [Puccinia graminis f. sp. tritici CRL 75-36-700-3]
MKHPDSPGGDDVPPNRLDRGVDWGRGRLSQGICKVVGGEVTLNQAVAVCGSARFLRVSQSTPVSAMDQLRSNCDVDSDSGANSLTKFDPLLAASGSPSSLPQSIEVSQSNSNSPNASLTGLSSFVGINVSKRQRSPNWTTKEDEQLARSWVDVSRNPIFASEQRGEEFFKRVCEHFNHHWHGNPRTPAGVRERWGILQPACLRFNVIYHQVVAHCQLTLPSPSPEHCRRLAHECFSEQTVTRTQRHRQFQYETVWEIVKDTPRFRMPTQPRPGPIVCSGSTHPVAATFSNPSGLSLIHVNGKSQLRQEPDISAVRQPSEINGRGSHPSITASHHPPSPVENKKRRISGLQYDESDPELEASSSSFALDDRRNERNGFQPSTSALHDRLALERERFMADKEERSRESIRKDKELDLRIKASDRDDLMLDLKIIQTNVDDCPDETSKRALDLMKAAVLKKYNNDPSVT